MLKVIELVAGERGDNDSSGQTTQAADVPRALGGHPADQGRRAGRHRVPHL